MDHHNFTQIKPICESDSQTRTAVIWMQFPPSSIQQWSWTQLFRGHALWKHCISRLRHCVPMPLVVVASPGSDVFKEALVELGVEYFQASSTQQIACFLEFAAKKNLSDLLILHGLFGLGLTPAALVEQISRTHDETQADVTMLVDLPSPLSAVMLRRRFLELLKEVPSGVWRDEDLGQVIERLEQALGSDPLRGGIAIERSPFTTCCNILPEDIPSYIPWMNVGDMQRLELAIGADEGNAKQVFPRLRHLIVQDLERAHRVRGPVHRNGIEVRRILFASNPSAYSGAEQCLVNTVQALRPSGLEIHCLIAQQGLFADRVREAGATVHTLQRNYATARVDMFLVLDDLVQAIAPDLVHCNAPVGLPLLAVSRLRGISLAYWVRTAEVAGVLDHLLSADMINPVSSFIAREVKKEMIQPEKVRVLHDCIDTDRFSPATTPSRDIRAELGITPDQFVILCIARFVRYKRHDVLIRAAAIASARHPNLRLILIGDPQIGADTYSETLLLIDRCGLSTKTNVIGFQDDVLSFEAGADVVVLCSEREPLGTVVLESMALAKPVIVAESGGLVEMIEDSVSGLYCGPNDPHSLAEQICRLIERPDYGHRLGEQARKSAVERFSMARHASQLLSLYGELANPLQNRRN